MVAGFLAVVGALAAIAAVLDLVLARGERERLRSVRRNPAIASAVSEILLARDHFSRVVSRYEAALAAQSRVLSRADGSSSDPDFGNTRPDVSDDNDLGPEVERLSQAKALARKRLLDAQRAWEMVRPGVGPAAACELWFGSGIMRAWQLGPIGFERFYYRFNHALDKSCWSIIEARRFRFGFGLGAELQSLALFVVGASAEQLVGLSAVALSGSEVAMRPGFVPTRTFRRLRRSTEAKEISHALLETHRVIGLVHGPSDQTRKLATEAFEAELGEALVPATVLPSAPALISIITKGPSVMFGAWAGPTPRVVLRASSDHGAWQSES